MAFVRVSEGGAAVVVGQAADRDDRALEIGKEDRGNGKEGLPRDGRGEPALALPRRVATQYAEICQRTLKQKRRSDAEVAAASCAGAALGEAWPDL